MVEENSTGAKNSIGLTVVDRRPVGIKFGDSVGAAGIKRGVLFLRDSLHLAEHLRGRRLIETDLGIHDPDSFQQMENPYPGDLRSGNRLVERQAHKTLGGKVIDFGSLRTLQQPNAGRSEERRGGKEGRS